MRKRINGAWYKEPKEPAEGQVSCPKCHAAMTEEAVLCMLCGYNRTTGEYVELPAKLRTAPKKKKRNPLSFIGSAFLAFFLLLFIAGYVFYEPILESNRDLLSDRLKEKLPRTLSRPINPKWLRKMTCDALVTVYEADIAKDLTQTHPPYAIGDTVTLQSDSGKSGQGIFQGVEGRNALLKAGGKTIQVPFLSLNLDCRLRADRAGRQVYIFTTATQRAEAFLVQ